MNVLGISSFSHESSCALIQDGKIIAIGEEERFNREKHTWKYPRRAIEYCLSQNNLRFADIDHVAFFWQPLREVTGNFWHVVRYFPKSMQLLRAKSGGGELGFGQRVWAMHNIAGSLQQQFCLPQKPKVHFIEHHLAHAASAFFVSAYDRSAVLTIDGRGESASTVFSLGDGKKLYKLKEIKVPHSLGHFYAAITDYLGFRPFFDEWKVMGMSAYGHDTFVKDFEKLLHFEKAGGYRLNLDYFSFHTHGGSKWMSDLFTEKFGPKFPPGENFSQRAADIAFALQRLIERAGLHLAAHIYELTHSENLCMTGGVVLNCLMNKKVVEQTPFKNFFFQPIANDAGTSLGAALYHYHHSSQGERNFIFEHPYWGPSYSNEEIEHALRVSKVVFTKSENIAVDAAKEIAEGKIVGWFQGRMECGPRALGNRSIVVDPTLSYMKDRLNARVKRREGFRPFAPSILEEKVAEYFLMPKNQNSPYMILIGDVREDRRGQLPAITHHDGTARVHTVNRKINPRYWQLIHEFEKIRGVPVLLNTSFNENEPIVCTPQEAINCFLRTEFDSLAIGDYLAKR